MSLIYHAFDNASRAGAFAADVVIQHPERSATLCATQTVADSVDPFPSVLRGFIVLVSRDADDAQELEDELAFVARGYGGVFAGT